LVERPWVAYRDLALTLISRELVVRYKRSALGLVWALAEPLFNVAVYSVVFGRFLGAWKGIPSYALYTMMGMLPWVFLASALEQSTGTLLDHGSLLRKIAFPRELLVIAVVASRLSTLLVGLALALILAAGKTGLGLPLAWENLWLLPVGLITLAVLTTGLCLAASAFQVLLRDVAFLVRFGLRLGFYACPIVYSLDRVPSDWSFIYQLNPLVGVLWCFQAVVAPVGSGPSDIALAGGLIAAIVLGLSGWLCFKKLQPAVADAI
jgi:lipopolysaccharide transport system permease protein